MEQTAINNYGFWELDQNEQECIDGGFGWIVIGVFVAGAIGDHVLKEETGRDAVQWVGYGLEQAGQALQDFGGKLMR